jgi:hypothetical protein
MGRAEAGFDRERSIARILIIRNTFRPERTSLAERRPGEVGGRNRAGGAEAAGPGLSAMLAGETRRHENQNLGSIHQLQPVLCKGVAPRQREYDRF